MKTKTVFSSRRGPRNTRTKLCQVLIEHIDVRDRVPWLCSSTTGFITSITIGRKDEEGYPEQIEIDSFVQCRELPCGVLGVWTSALTERQEPFALPRSRCWLTALGHVMEEKALEALEGDENNPPTVCLIDGMFSREERNG